MIIRFRSSGLLPSLLAAAAVAVSSGEALAAPHAKPKPHAARKSAEAAKPATTTDANGLSVPVLDNKAWVLMDFNTGQVLAASNADEPLPPASLTKMMTSFLVEQALRTGKLKPTDQVAVSMNAWCRGSSQESCMYLPLNGHASVIDMLRGIIIQSANDASKAVAEHMAGSEAGFAQLMNAEAAQLGMTHTHFANPSGLPDPTHKASAHDLAILARTIIHDSADYYPIYAERTFTYNGIKQGNRNALLYTDPTVDGLKTGHTEEAGYCLVASSKREGMRLITVIMNAPSTQARADQTRVLLNWGFSNFEHAQPVQAGAVVATAKVDFGKADSVPAVLASPWTLTVPRGQAQGLQTSVELKPGLEAPIAKGAVIGKVLATAGGKPVGEAPLVAQQAVERAGFLQRLWQHLGKLFGK